MQIKINSIEEITAAAKTFLTTLRQPHPSHTGGEGGGSPTVIAFYGTMGAGKTTFIAALCRELGVTEPVTSPTFAIVNEYEINDELRMMNDEYKEQSSIIHHPSSIYHFDFYRIKRLEEAYDMGFEDYLYSGHLCLIEWPELIEDLLPDDALRVHIEVTPDNARTIRW